MGWQQSDFYVVSWYGNKCTLYANVITLALPKYYSREIHEKYSSSERWFAAAVDFFFLCLHVFRDFF